MVRVVHSLFQEESPRNKHWRMSKSNSILLWKLNALRETREAQQEKSSKPKRLLAFPHEQCQFKLLDTQMDVLHKKWPVVNMDHLISHSLEKDSKRALKYSLQELQTHLEKGFPIHPKLRMSQIVPNTESWVTPWD